MKLLNNGTLIYGYRVGKCTYGKYNGDISVLVHIHGRCAALERTKNG